MRLLRHSVLLALVFSVATLGAQSSPAQSASPKISKAEADELFQSVDEIVKFVSADTGLPIKTRVNRKLADRDEVQRYVEERMAEDEDQKRLERSELVLKKLGLLPEDFQLRRFLVSLLREQVAAFYDSKRKTVFMLDWLSPETQKPIMAHELTHALQDQDVDLEKWIDGVRAEAKRTQDPMNAEATIDEVIGARSALVEGQGMAVLVDYSLAPTGQSLADMPQMVAAIKQGIGSGEGMPVMKSAPLMLRESLIFPYRDGLGFVAALLQSGGKKLAYSEALQHPPQDTRQILSPEAYLKGEHLVPMHIPDLNPVLGATWRMFDAGSIGQFDISLLAKQFGHDPTDESMAQSWRGGYYWAGAGNSEPKTSKDIRLLLVTKWETPAAAQSFATLYQGSLSKKYARATPLQGSNGRQWQTDQGEVSFDPEGDMLIISEGFTDAQRTSIQKAVLAASEDAKAAKVATGNLSTHVMRPFFTAMLRCHAFEYLRAGAAQQ